MPILGTTALATVAAPSGTSPAPYKIYTVMNSTGMFLGGFTIMNAANIPVSLTIYQDSLANTIYSTTLAAYQGTSLAATVALQAPVVVVINSNLAAGETLLALASQGGQVSIEIDGLLSVMDPATMYLLAIMMMLNAEFGTQIPTQSMLNASSMSLT